MFSLKHPIPYYMSVFPVKMVVFTLEMDYPSETDNQYYKSAKIEGEKTGKVRRIICPKLKPFHSQMKTDYPLILIQIIQRISHPVDITSETDNLHFVVFL